MHAILDGREIPTWENMIPEARRAELRPRHGIKKRVKVFFEKFADLVRPIQENLVDALRQQTSLPNVLFDDSVCTEISVFPEEIRKATTDLFKFLFDEQLTSIIVGNECLRDIQYSAIYTDLPSRICPFCGVGHFRAPGAPRHALDHYMPISRYPFVGADLRNLPPMCSECNSDFKKNIDILKNDAGLRERCVDPYSGPVYRVTLTGSLPFAGRIHDGIRLPQWEIQLVDGPYEQAENWDRIFKIRDRYKRDILDAEFRSWLEHFAYWYVAGNHGLVSGDAISASIPEYIDTVIQYGYADKAFLKAETFRLLRDECENPDRGPDMKSFLEILINTMMN